MKPKSKVSFIGVLIALPLLVSSLMYALFTNGGFESGDYTGWTKSIFLNPGLTGTPPFTGANIVRNAGGVDQSIIVTAASPQTGVDPILGAAATLKFPYIGTYSARVNGPITGNVSNTIKQQSVIAAGDVDTFDNQVHVRFVVGPVLENPGHSPQQQPYFYVAVRNVTRGNALLFESLNFANQAGVPWKTANGILYTDWQIVDIAPGAASIAVGDNIEVEITAADCSQGGHFGYIYADGFGAQLPGLAISKTESQDPVPAGASLNYTFLYRNTGTIAVDNVVVTETIPAQTTFISVSSASCAEAAGVVTCNFGTLQPGAQGTFTITVGVNTNATGTINNGNYTIAGTNFPPVLGPLVTTTVGIPINPTQVPTLDQIGLLILGALVAAVGVLMLRKSIA